MREFYNYSQAEMYLLDSVIRFSGEPVVVSYMEGEDEGEGDGINCCLKKLTQRTASYERVSIYDYRIDMSPVPLGYVNWKRYGEVSILIAYRVPLRMWKVGLTSNNLALRGIMHGDTGESSSTVINSKALSNTIKGNFPSLDKCIQEEQPQAFSRRFAILNKKLWFAQLSSPIGEIIGGELSLIPQYAFMSEALRQDVENR